jgi:hypothetical protein
MGFLSPDVLTVRPGVHASETDSQCQGIDSRVAARFDPRDKFLPADLAMSDGPVFGRQMFVLGADTAKTSLLCGQSPCLCS